MEYLREAKVVIEKDTNKSNVSEVLQPHEHECIEDFVERVTERLREIFTE